MTNENKGMWKAVVLLVICLIGITILSFQINKEDISKKECCPEGYYLITAISNKGTPIEKVLRYDCQNKEEWYDSIEPSCPIT